MAAKSRNARKRVSLIIVAITLSNLPYVAHAVDTTIHSAKIVRIGYLANLTQAPALVAKDQALFEKHLKKDGTEIQYVTFNAGPDEINALKGNAIDLAFMGPNPTVNGYLTTSGTLLRVISGSTSGGAELVVDPKITKPSQLKSLTLATPQLGNTQDVALRSWLRSQGLKTSITGKGDVTVIPTANSQTLALFKSGQINGAWIPEPWSSQLVIKAGAHVLINEKSLWSKGNFVTTDLVSTTDFLNKYPATIAAILSAEIDAINELNTNKPVAQTSIQHQLLLSTGSKLDPVVLERAWSNLTFTFDPLAPTLRRSAINAVSVGLLPNLPADGLKNLYDLRILNSLLRAKNIHPVLAYGLGKQ